MSRMRYLVDGRSAGVDPADRGLAYGDGLFETMAAQDGRIRWLERHMARLADGCRQLRIPLPDPSVVRSEINRLVPAEGRAVVKLMVTRGPGTRGYRPPAEPDPCRILGIGPWPDYPLAHYTRGIVVRSCRLRLGENPAMAGLKHLCRLEQVLAQQELIGTDADEGLLFGCSGYVVGGTSSNVFAVQGDALLTPAVTRCGVKGVMRGIVLEAAAALGLQAVEADLDAAALAAAEELFMTNAVAGVRPVRELDGRPYPVGPGTRRIMRHLEAPAAGGDV